MEIVWRPKALEFVVACDDGSTQMWKVVEKPERGGSWCGWYGVVEIPRLLPQVHVWLIRSD